MNILAEQQILPRYYSGCDYGAERPVLAKKGNKTLYKLPGRKYWSGRSQQAYAKQVFVLAEYDLMKYHIFPAYTKTTNVWHGRFTEKKLREHAKEIAEFFGISEVQALCIKEDQTINFL